MPLKQLARFARTSVGHAALRKIFRADLKIERLETIPDSLRGDVPLDTNVHPGRPPREAASQNLPVPSQGWSPSGATLTAAYREGRLSPVDLIATLNEIGGRHGCGVVDLVEDRMVGMKSRGIYETPGGSLLYTAHSELEQLVLDRRTLSAKDMIAPRYADLVYEGRWWSTEREAYDAFVNVTQERVTGTVTLRLFKGATAVVGRESAHALYDERFVTFGEDDVYQQSDAAPIAIIELVDRDTSAKGQDSGPVMADEEEYAEA